MTHTHTQTSLSSNKSYHPIPYLLSSIAKKLLTKCLCLTGTWKVDIVLIYSQKLLKF